MRSWSPSRQLSTGYEQCRDRLATVAAVCVLVATVTVVAAWIINTALATNPYMRAQASIKSGALTLGKYGLTLTSAPSGSTLPPMLQM
jgi:hypothetical protein